LTVIDASALLAYVLDEAGAEVVQDALEEESSIGTVNLAEVLAKLSDVGQDPSSAMDRLAVLPIEVVVFDEDLAVETARLRPITSTAGLSLGDRACLALARRLGRRVLTADVAWVGLVPDVEVEVIR
jgi:PIN domain nuclease of toxin-antitoxin system